MSLSAGVVRVVLAEGGAVSDGFPLYRKAKKAGAFENKSLLISAPTATGKSKIGRDLVTHYTRTKKKGLTNTYLVPFKSLAREVHESFKADCPDSIVRIATGDYSDPIDYTNTDVLIATYEKFDSLMREDNSYTPYVVVADEFHIVGDESRGPRIEALATRFLMSGRKGVATLVYPLSAIVGNPEQLAEWLNVSLLRGGEADRKVKVSYKARYTDDKDSVVAREVSKLIKKGEQMLLFCGTRATAERQASRIADQCQEILSASQKKSLTDVVRLLGVLPSTTDRLKFMVSNGVAYHHAGLEKDVRESIENAFLDKGIKVICCTPTLAAGVNLPAAEVIVRDPSRAAFIGRRRRKVYLTSGQILNMLGRAGRPGYSKQGTGLLLFRKAEKKDPAAQALWKKIENRESEDVRSRLGDRFEYLMEFILGVIQSRGECPRADIRKELCKTLWYFQKKPEFGEAETKVEELILEQLGSDLEKTEGMKINSLIAVSDRIVADILSNSGVQYEATINPTDMACSCPAFKFTPYPKKPCKHIFFLIKEVLVGKVADREEIRNIAIQVLLDTFPEVVSLETRISQALELLKRWNFVGEKNDRYSITKPGRVALSTYLGLQLAHEISSKVLTYRDELEHAQRIILADAINDFVGPAEDPAETKELVAMWVDETPRAKIENRVRYYTDFLQVVGGLGRLLFAYTRFANLYDKPRILRECKTLLRRNEYGVKEDILPICILNIEDVGRARARELHDKGYPDLWSLASAKPMDLVSAQIYDKLADRIVEGCSEKVAAIAEFTEKVSIRSKYESAEQLLPVLGALSDATGVSPYDIEDYILPRLTKGRRGSDRQRPHPRGTAKG